MQRAATAIRYVLAAELRACGIDLSFTLVLDLDYGRCRAIGDRALHGDARTVAALAKSLNHGLALAGMAACGKHFPGHGYVEADSHVAAPINARPLEVLLADAPPYDWLDLTLQAVMPAHIVYPRVDHRPAGFSPVWLQRILREQLHFDGAIFSDDLSMAGARVAGGCVDAAQAALDAGCDMLLVCNQPEHADDVLRCLRDRPGAPRARRLAGLRARGPAPYWDELMSEPRYREARRLIERAFPTMAASPS